MTRKISHFFALALAFLATACLPDINFTDLQTSGAIESQDDKKIEVLFSSDAGTVTVELESSYPWTVKGINDRADEWISWSPEKGKRGTATVEITVPENNTYDERSATLVFKSVWKERTIVVTQKQLNALLVSADKVELDKDGGSFAIEVQHNVNFTVNVDPASASWLSQTKTKGLESHTVSFTAAANDGVEKRHGTVTFTSDAGLERVDVYQAGSDPVLVLGENEYSLSAAGGEIKVDVASNVDVTYEIKASWIKEITTKALSTNTFRFTVEPNASYDDRSAVIVFKNARYGLSENVIIYQAQQDAIIPGESSYDFDYKTQTFEMNVDANVDFSVSFDDGVDWIHMIGTKGLTSHTLTFSLDENNTKDTRETAVRLIAGNLCQILTFRQLPTTHFPETEKEIEESIALSHSISDQLQTFISPQSDIIDINTLIDQAETIDGVVHAFTNPSESTLAIMQKDSIIFNILLKTEDIETTMPSMALSSAFPFANNPISKDETGEYTLSDNKRAIILAPFQWQRNDVLDRWKNMLKKAFSEVEVLPDDKADVMKFRGKNLAKNDCIIIKTHGGTGYYAKVDTFLFIPYMKDERNQQTISMTGTEYNKKSVNALLNSGLLSWDDVAIAQIEGSNAFYFCFTTRFLDEVDDHAFDNAIVMLQQCESAVIPKGEGSLIQAFLDKGASVVTGYRESIHNRINSYMTEDMITSMISGFSLQDAYHFWQNAPCYADYSTYLKSQVSKEDKLYCDHTLFHYYPENSVPYFIRDYFPTLNTASINGNKAHLSWNSILESYDPYQKWGERRVGSIYYTTNIDIIYEVYIDKKLVSEENLKEKSLDVPSLTVGEHKWYVIAKGVEKGKELFAYQSKEGDFNIETELEPAPHISINTNSVEFGEVVLGETASHSVTIENTGNAVLTISHIDNPDGFSSTIEGVFNVGTSIEPGESCIVALNFSPSEAKDYNDSFNIYSDDPDTPFIDIKVSGTGVNPINVVIPEEIRNKMEPYIPIYDGINPPDVTGTYLISPFVAVYCEDGEYAPGHQVVDRTIRFSNQNTVTNTLDYDSYTSNSRDSGPGAFISGTGDNFSAFFDSEGQTYGIYTKLALVISGSISSNGIKDLYYAFVMVKKGDDPNHRLMEEGVFRVFKDSDGISVKSNWNPSSASPAHLSPEDINVSRMELVETGHIDLSKLKK